MEPLLTLVIAIGGIATGIGAIWAAMVARSQARLTERSLDEQRQSFQEQTEIARRQAELTEQSLAQTERSLAEQGQFLREQNERARLNLEVDLLLRLDERFSSPHMLASRRQAAKYVRDTFIVNGELQEVQDYNRATWEVQNFFEQLGYLVNIGALRVEEVDNQFGQYVLAQWALYEPAIYKERAESGEPRLYEHWEQLSRLIVERLRQQSRKEEFTTGELRQYIELECSVGEESPTTTD